METFFRDGLNPQSAGRYATDKTNALNEGPSTNGRRALYLSRPWLWGEEGALPSDGML